MDNKAWAQEVAKKIKERNWQLPREMSERFRTQQRMVYSMIALVRRSVGGPMVSGAA